MEQGRKAIRYYQYRGPEAEPIEAEVIVETPVSLTVNGEIWLTFMCTPTHLEALAVGFLFNEAMIDSMDEVASVRLCHTGDNVDVWLRQHKKRPEQWARTSGCTGGLTSIDPTAPRRPLGPGFRLPAQRVNQLLDGLYQAQELYRETRGVHSSALADGDQIQLTAEDIGRHNTLDKLAGRCLLERLPRQPVMLTTGRISSEMLRKAARMDVPVVISRTSPSSLSIALAEQFGVTLIGYARRDRFNVYAHSERIL